MRIDVKIGGSAKLDRALARLSGGELARATEDGLADGARDVAIALRKEMSAVFDRPTRFILNSVKIIPSDDKKSVTIEPTYFGGNPVDPQQILQAQAWGGQRSPKRLEKLLQMTGHMPAGWYAVPGQGARIDAYGNMSAGQLQQILSQLRVRVLDGIENRMSFDKRRAVRAQRAAGGRFFVIPPGRKVQPGVYQREFIGRNITPVLIFVRSATYQPRLDLDRIKDKYSLEEQVGKKIRSRIYQAAEALE